MPISNEIIYVDGDIILQIWTNACKWICSRKCISITFIKIVKGVLDYIGAFSPAISLRIAIIKMNKWIISDCEEV